MRPWHNFYKQNQGRQHSPSSGLSDLILLAHFIILECVFWGQKGAACQQFFTPTSLTLMLAKLVESLFFSGQQEAECIVTCWGQNREQENSPLFQWDFSTSKLPSLWCWSQRGPVHCWAELSPVHPPLGKSFHDVPKPCKTEPKRCPNY